MLGGREGERGRESKRERMKKCVCEGERVCVRERMKECVVCVREGERPTALFTPPHRVSRPASWWPGFSTKHESLPISRQEVVNCVYFIAIPEIVEGYIDVMSVWVVQGDTSQGILCSYQ